MGVLQIFIGMEREMHYRFCHTSNILGIFFMIGTRYMGIRYIYVELDIFVDFLGVDYVYVLWVANLISE